MIHYQENNFQTVSIEKESKHQALEVFSHGSGTKTFSVGANAQLHYLCIVSQTAELELQIKTDGPGASIIIHGICLAKELSSIKLNLQAELSHDEDQIDIHLVSFLQDRSDSDIRANILIQPGTKGCEGHLLEENILLGDKLKIKTLPMLDVRSNDVKASHGARIEKLDPQRLFYLQSRGLDDTQAKNLIISGYFENIFAPFKHEQANLDIARLEKEWLDYLLTR